MYGDAIPCVPILQSCFQHSCDDSLVHISMLSISFHLRVQFRRLYRELRARFEECLIRAARAMLCRRYGPVEFDVDTVDDRVQLWKEYLHLGIRTHLGGESFKCSKAIELKLPNDGASGLASTTKGVGSLLEISPTSEPRQPSSVLQDPFPPPSCLGAL